jgi:hypothetical protein
VHIGALCDVLTRAGVDTTAWTPGGLLAAIDARNRADGWSVVDPGQQRDPLAYFAALLRRTLATTENVQADISRAEREREERAAAAARREAEHTRWTQTRTAMPGTLRAQLEELRAKSAERGRALRRKLSMPVDTSLSGSPDMRG